MTEEFHVHSAPARHDRFEFHQAVLPAEIMRYLRPTHGRTLMDCTVGGGGHTAIFAEAGASVFGLDQDPEALAHTSELLAAKGLAPRVHLARENFRNLSKAYAEWGLAPLDGILMDLGVSSHQLGTPERGFSFRADGPLDMRMDPASSVTAKELVNTLPAEELEQIFRAFGEERYARRIAKKIVESRDSRPIATTSQLAELVASCTPRAGKIHPATRVFQALRIAVNDELGALEHALGDAVQLLAPAGRIAVISFHSLEDRIVKRFFQRLSAPSLDRPEWPEPRPNPEYMLKLLTKRPVMPEAAEQERNPRSRSARLRVAERLTPEPQESPT